MARSRASVEERILRELTYDCKATERVTRHWRHSPEFDREEILAAIRRVLDAETRRPTT